MISTSILYDKLFPSSFELFIKEFGNSKVFICNDNSGRYQVLDLLNKTLFDGMYADNFVSGSGKIVEETDNGLYIQFGTSSNVYFFDYSTETMTLVETTTE